MKKNKKVSIVMGSQSDYKTMKLAENILKKIGVSFETKIISEDTREELLEKTKELVNATPDISARVLANELGVGKDTALKYKAQVSGVDRQTHN